MKSILSALVLASAALIATETASASGISNCSGDQYASSRINEVPNDLRIDARNKNGEVVGALVFNEPEKKTFGALYLCGANTGYYYAEGKPSEWITTPGRTIEVGFMYNDEYEVFSSAKTITAGEFFSQVEVNLTVKWTGEDESDADYQNFSDTIVLPTPQITNSLANLPTHRRHSGAGVSFLPDKESAEPLVLTTEAKRKEQSLLRDAEAIYWYPLREATRNTLLGRNLLGRVEEAFI